MITMHKDLHNIDVPKEEVFAAIQSGIQRGQELEKKVKRKKTTKRIGILSSAAAALLLASGFIFTPVSNVLAQVPLIGEIYEKYHMSIGEQLASEQLLTEMSLVASDQNIQVEITSIFYDAAYVGLTFTTTGAVTDNIGGDQAPEAGFTYEMFDGKDTSGWGGELGTLTKTEEGYTGALILDVPVHVTDDVISFPLTFTHMAGVRGEWSFDLAVEKLPFKQQIINKQVTSQNNELSITFDDIEVGQTNAKISYKATFESTIEGQFYTFEAYNMYNEEISLDQISDDTLLLKLPKDTTFIKIVPILKVHDVTTEHLESITFKLN